MRWIRYSIVPALACLSVAFAVLPRTGGDATIRMVESADGTVAFEPASLSVERGARILFRNEGDRTHSATCAGCLPGQAWSTGLVQPGQDVFVTFPDDGAFSYGDATTPPDSRARLLVGDATAPAPSPTATATGSPEAVSS